MERQSQKIRPYLPKEVRLDIAFTWPNFIKKGHRRLLKLKIDLYIASSEVSSKKNAKKALLRKTFQRAKFVRNLDLSQVTLHSRDEFLSIFQYIAKKMSKVSAISIEDSRSIEGNFKGLVTLWPKYMKNLRSLDYEPTVRTLQVAGGYVFGNVNPNILPYQIYLMTDYLKYLKKLEEIRVSTISGNRYGYLDNLWIFEIYPKSLKKLSICIPDHSFGKQKTSLAHLKRLEELEVNFEVNKSVEFINSVMSKISQATQLETLNLRFPRDFEITGSFCETIKSLTKLQKIKLQLHLRNQKNNLQILNSLRECPLKSLNLKVDMNSCEEVSLISDLLENKKKDIRVLKLHLSFQETFDDNPSEISRLVQAIDNLESLTSLYLSAEFTFDFFGKLESSEMDEPSTNEEDDLLFQFPKLFSKSIPIRKFRISFNQPNISKAGFFALIENLKKISHNLEKLEIDVPGYQPQDQSEADFIVEFLRSLRNIRSLKLLSIDIQLLKFYLGLIETIKTLKLLKTLYLGEISGEIAKPIFFAGVKQILSKYGLRTFDCSVVLNDESEFSDLPEGSYRINLVEVLKKNPFLTHYPTTFIDYKS